LGIDVREIESGHPQRQTFPHASSGALPSKPSRARAQWILQALLPLAPTARVVVELGDRPTQNDATDIVQAEVAYLTGSVVSDNGMAGFGGSIRAGSVPNGWFGNGFNNPRGAHIHLILMDHGPAIPGLVSNQINTLRGGCTFESLPPAFPDVAKADGIPGPNTCRLVQFAVLEP